MNSDDNRRFLYGEPSRFTKPNIFEKPNIFDQAIQVKLLRLAIHCEKYFAELAYQNGIRVVPHNFHERSSTTPERLSLGDAFVNPAPPPLLRDCWIGRDIVVSNSMAPKFSDLEYYQNQDNFVYTYYAALREAEKKKTKEAAQGFQELITSLIYFHEQLIEVLGRADLQGQVSTLLNPERNRVRYFRESVDHEMMNK